MKAALLFLIMLSSLLCFGQATSTIPPKPDPNKFERWEDYNEALINWKIQKDKVSPSAPIQCTTIAKCKALVKTESDAKDISQAELSTRLDEVAQLKKEKEAIQKQYDDAIEILFVLDAQMRGVTLSDEQSAKLKTVLPGKALDLGTSVEKSQMNLVKFATDSIANIKKLADDNATLTGKYNDLLSRANAVIAELNARVAQRQRALNALAMYSLMPKAQPYQLPPPPVFNSNTLNCTSNSVGSSTYTNCR